MSHGLQQWLVANELAEFEPLLVENEIDLTTLKVLNEADLRELGLAFGPRKRFLNAIAVLKASGAPGVRERGREGDAPAPGSMTGERRHLTVMFCDLVGSTTLSERLDPEEMHLLIQSYYRKCTDVVLRYEGYVANYLGDGLLIYFGWPVAHEDAAERSVRAALEMVDAVKSIRAAEPLVVRIGLAAGPVVVGEASREGKVETGLVVGEIPNLAARLQELAGPDEVVIAPSIRQLLGNAFNLTAIGTHSLKGIAEPVPVCRVDGARRVEGRFKAAHAGAELPPLIGRNEEAALLGRLWQQARGGAGQVALIGGQAGIGKSRLVQELREGITEAHGDFLYQCSPYHLNSPLHPFIEHFETAAGFSPDDTADERLEKLEGALVGGAAMVAEAAPLFADLLLLPTARYQPLQLSPQKRKEKTLEAVAAQIETRSLEAPVLVVVEDIHWIDPTSQELLEHLVPRVRDHPIILVMTYRLDCVPPWAGQAGVTTIVLDRLGRHAGGQLVQTVAEGRSIPPEVVDEILAHTDGVPLFVEELTKSVIESGHLRQEGGHYALQGSLATLAIPASLRDLLMARLDRLGAAKELAQIGSCIGREFPSDLLKRIAGLEPGRFEESLDTLVAAELVTRHGDTAYSRFYRFKHALIQDAAYDSLLKSTRCELHRKIARILEGDFGDWVANAPGLLAHHYTQARNLECAIPLWRRAGILAVRRVAMKEAVAHFQKGLGLIRELPASPERDEVELTIREPLNAAWTGLRGWAAPEVGENAEAVLRLAERQGNAQSLMLAMWWVWTSTITQGKIADSKKWVERLLEKGSTTGDIDLRVLGHSTAMVQHFFSGRLRESSEQTDRALALWEPRHAGWWIEQTGFDMRTFVEVYACQLVWVMGYPDKAKQLSDRCVEHARSGGQGFNLMWALTFSAYVYAYRCETGPFLDRIEEADRLAREQSLAFIYEVSVPQARGMAELQSGRPGAAIPLLRQGIDHWTSAGGRVRVPLLKASLAEAVARRGDLARALELIDECVGQIAEAGGQERLWLSEVLRCRGWILARQGRGGEAEAVLRDAVECARRQEAKSWELRSATTLAEFLAKGGRREDARVLLAPVLGWFTEGAETRDQVRARALLEKLSGPGERC
jgi:class 3 adenylate cyclase/tetratricopeptide (TPR) repeat protein